MQSKAASVAAYLAEQPADRRAALEAVRAVIRENLDPDYEEGMQYGMIGYYVPHRVYPPGYHADPKQPLPFVCLASQKNYLSVYLMGLYGEQDARGEPANDHARWFSRAWAETGKKLDMGKSCIRFKRAEDLALDVIGEAVRRLPAKAFVKLYEDVIKDSRHRKSTTAKAETTKKAASARKAGAAKTQPNRAPKKRGAARS
jgi:hypothetical protein